MNVQRIMAIVTLVTYILGACMLMYSLRIKSEVRESVCSVSGGHIVSSLEICIPKP